MSFLTQAPSHYQPATTFLPDVGRGNRIQFVTVAPSCDKKRNWKAREAVIYFFRF